MLVPGNATLHAVSAADDRRAHLAFEDGGRSRRTLCAMRVEPARAPRHLASDACGTCLGVALDSGLHLAVEGAVVVNLERLRR